MGERPHCPDISQLPALANFFDVTTDHLLGVDIRRKEDEVKRIVGEALKYEQRGGEDQMQTLYICPKMMYNKENKYAEVIPCQNHS